MTLLLLQILTVFHLNQEGAAYIGKVRRYRDQHDDKVANLEVKETSRLSSFT
ncbi:hypothetical protein LWS67_14335 [Bacillus atrophaeus]|uniref:hypothetical protein n=1 Tax=Bacillus atrophaeus TaxID=1452 RepID=UPI001EFBE3A8|nr:hypothetical protein [Bacillus atrophaeus]MCG8397700.1 hypothetical protein [Bacillus atrophaeus]